MTLAFEAGARAKRIVRPVVAAAGEFRGAEETMTGEDDARPNPSFYADIVAIAERRDRRAFARLFEHFAPRIKGFLLRGGAAASAADDLAQEALLTVWRKAGYFDPEKASASTWIFTIVRNLRIDGQRRIRRQAIYEAAMLHEDEEPPIRPDEALQSSQLQARVQDALRDLPEEQLAVVRLSFVDGKAHADIAEVLGIPLGTVKSRIRLAMNRLKGKLEGIQ
ncbi:MAG: sigma-70 family RNA polymerase sigma factor [Beijerinckiaceae bacterium]